MIRDTTVSGFGIQDESGDTILAETAYLQDTSEAQMTDESAGPIVAEEDRPIVVDIVEGTTVRISKELSAPTAGFTDTLLGFSNEELATVTSWADVQVRVTKSGQQVQVSQLRSYGIAAVAVVELTVAAAETATVTELQRIGLNLGQPKSDVVTVAEAARVGVNLGARLVDVFVDYIDIPVQ